MKYSSTVGIECSTLLIGNGSVMIMDFAGQLEYTVTHQYFLSNEVYLSYISYPQTLFYLFPFILSEAPFSNFP